MSEAIEEKTGSECCYSLKKTVIKLDDLKSGLKRAWAISDDEWRRHIATANGETVAANGTDIDADFANPEHATASSNIIADDSIFTYQWHNSNSSVSSSASQDDDIEVEAEHAEAASLEHPSILETQADANAEDAESVDARQTMALGAI